MNRVDPFVNSRTAITNIWHQRLPSTCRLLTMQPRKAHTEGENQVVQ
jgi:hypothetical protein